MVEPDDVVRFSTRPTVRDILLNGGELEWRSVGALTTGTFITTVNAMDAFAGREFNVLWLVLGLAWLTGAMGVLFAGLALVATRDTLLQPNRIEADGQRLTTASSQTSTTQEWSVFHRARETSLAFTLDIKGKQPVALTKRDVDPATIDAFRALLEQVALLPRMDTWAARLAPARGVAIGIVGAVVLALIV